MKTLFNKLALWIGILFGAVLLSLFVIAAFFDKQIGDIFLTELNRSLKSELQVENVELSLISEFPSATVNLEGVQLDGAFRDAGRLLKAEKVALKFGWRGLFNKKFRINSVEIENGALHVLIDRLGRASYNVFKDSENSSSEASEFSLLLKNASLKNIEVIYVDEPTKQEIAFTVDQADLNGAFSNDRFDLISNADIYSDFVEIDKQKYLVGKKISYDAQIDVDLDKGVYLFDKVIVNVENNRFRVDGNVKEENPGKNFDLELKGENCTLKSIIDLLPIAYQKSLGDFTSRGSFEFLTTIKGKRTTTQSPLVNMTFGLEDGSITSPRMDYPIRDVSFNATFNNGKSGLNEHAHFQIPDFVGKMKGESLRFSLEAKNLDDPKLDMEFKGVLNLASIYGLLNMKEITSGDGKLKVNSLKLSGYYKDMVDPSRIYRVNANGNFNFEQASMKINGENMTLSTGTLKMDNNNLTLEKFLVKGAGSDFQLDGSLKNLLPVLFSDSMNTKNAKLEFQASLDSKRVDLDRLIEMATIEGGTKGATTEAEEQENIFDFLDGTFSSRIAEINYEKVIAKNFSSNLKFRDKKLTILNSRVDAMGGLVNLSGFVLFEDKIKLESRISAKKLDSEECFQQCENFGQDLITDKNLSGDLDVELAIKAFWDKDGTFDDEKLDVLADVELTNGELINLEMLKQFSKYIKLKDLERIKFTSLKNQLAIRGRKFYLPTMFIQNNAVNMVLSGRQSFDNDIDYLIKVNAGQVLMNKFKKFNPTRKPKKAKKKGFLNVYVTVDGDIEDYQFEYGKKTYNANLDKLEPTFNQIRRAVESGLLVDPIRENSEWEDSGV